MQSSNLPGFGFWAVRGRTLYVVWGVWSAAECERLSISVLEYLVSFWASSVLSSVCPGVTHLLEFTDNSGAEWSMRREAPAAHLMQLVADRRAAFLLLSAT